MIAQGLGIDTTDPASLLPFRVLDRSNNVTVWEASIPLFRESRALRRLPEQRFDRVIDASIAASILSLTLAGRHPREGTHSALFYGV